MKTKNTIAFNVGVALGILFLITVFLVLPWVVWSYFEASSFNRLTGGDATTWDAMFCQLRVTAGKY